MTSPNTRPRTGIYTKNKENEGMILLPITNPAATRTLAARMWSMVAVRGPQLRCVLLAQSRRAASTTTSPSETSDLKSKARFSGLFQRSSNSCANPGATSSSRNVWQNRRESKDATRAGRGTTPANGRHLGRRRCVRSRVRGWQASRDEEVCEGQHVSIHLTQGTYSAKTGCSCG